MMSETPLETMLVRANEMLSSKLSQDYVFTQEEMVQLGIMYTITAVLFAKAKLARNDSKVPNLRERHNQSSDVL